MTSPFRSEIEDRRPHPDAAPAQQISWIIAMLTPYANDLATEAAVSGDAADDGARLEIEEAAAGLAREIGAAPVCATTAAQIAWASGSNAAATFLRALKSRIWPLGRMVAPSERIIDEARRTMAGSPVFLLDALLIEEASRITLAAMPPRPKSAGRYAKRF